VIAAEGDRAGELIAEAGGANVRGAGGAGLFAVAAGEEDIPRIVEALVRGGCRVREVRPERPGLRDVLRRRAAGSRDDGRVGAGA
jgi:hypothetical protein